MALPRAIHTEWRPLDVLTGGEPKALIVLNQPLEQQSRQLIKKHWDNAVIRIAADGGLLHLKELDNDQQSFIPDIVCGDFDSLQQDDLNLYAELGSHIIPTPDQDETDFTKSVTICAETLQDKNVEVKSVLAFSNNGHRLDHVMANLNTLYRTMKWSHFSLYLVGERALSWILNMGKHKIFLSKHFADSHIGLIPLGAPCIATTSGLKWNLLGDEMKFGDLVSTSNGWNGTDDFITICNNSPLVFTMSFNLSMD